MIKLLLVCLLPLQLFASAHTSFRDILEDLHPRTILKTLEREKFLRSDFLECIPILDGKNNQGVMLIHDASTHQRLCAKVMSLENGEEVSRIAKKLRKHFGIPLDKKFTRIENGPILVRSLGLFKIFNPQRPKEHIGYLQMQPEAPGTILFDILFHADDPDIPGIFNKLGQEIRALLHDAGNLSIDEGSGYVESSFTHNDLHLCNIILGENNEFYILDLDRYEKGRPCLDFRLLLLRCLCMNITANEKYRTRIATAGEHFLLGYFSDMTLPYSRELLKDFGRLLNDYTQAFEHTQFKSLKTHVREDLEDLRSYKSLNKKEVRKSFNNIKARWLNVLKEKESPPRL